MSKSESDRGEDNGASYSISEGDLLHILHTLSSQKTSKKLKSELKRLLEGRLPGSGLQIFEIRTVRDDDWKKSESMVYLDSLEPKKEAVDIKMFEGLEEAIKSRNIVKFNRGDSKRMAMYITGSATSHVVVFDHQLEDEVVIEPLFYSFGNLLELLRSRDRDSLTGFLNRLAFNRSMSEMVLNKLGNPDFTADELPYTALAIMDLDHFKSVNDNFGHLIGDETLLIFSQEIRTVFRQTDIIARYGGEEFVVILKDVEAKRTGLVLERCRQKIEEREFPQVGRVTVSIGFASVTDSSPPMTALDRADKALYYAKENGRNRVCSYEKLVKEGKIEPSKEKSNDVVLWD